MAVIFIIEIVLFFISVRKKRGSEDDTDEQETADPETTD